MKLLCLLIVVVGVAAANTGVQLNLYAVDPFSNTRDLTGHFSIPVVGQHLINVKDIQYGPIVVLTPNYEEHPSSVNLHAFLAPQGLSSFISNENFKPFYDYLLKSEKLSGLVFFSGSIGNSVFLQFQVQQLTLPDSWNTADLLQLIANPKIPVVYIAPTDVFNHHQFFGLFPLVTFHLQGDSVSISEISGPYPHHPLSHGPLYPWGQLQRPIPPPVFGPSEPIAFEKIARDVAVH